MASSVNALRLYWQWNKKCFLKLQRSRNYCICNGNIESTSQNKPLHKMSYRKMWLLPLLWTGPFRTLLWRTKNTKFTWHSRGIKGDERQKLLKEWYLNDAAGNGTGGRFSMIQKNGRASRGSRCGLWQNHIQFWNKKKMYGRGCWEKTKEGGRKLFVWHLLGPWMDVFTWTILAELFQMMITAELEGRMKHVRNEQNSVARTMTDYKVALNNS